MRLLSVRVLLGFVTLCLASNVSATVEMNWIFVGDPGNPEHTITADDGTSGYGAVDYSFRISELEITNTQYAEFLNAVAATDPNGLYWTAMQTQLYGGITRSGSSGSYTYDLRANMGNKPVNYVDFFDAARFANWLHNDQPTGVQDASTTEDGAYTFTGVELVGPRNPGAKVFLPNEHEWHKAAFYEPGANTHDQDEWWLFTNRSDTIPQTVFVSSTGDVLNPGPTIVNYGDAANWNGSPGTGNVVTVGATGNQTYYGVKDMGGNVFEWIEADLTKPDPFEAGPYVVRGGSFATTAGHIRSSERNSGRKSGHTHNFADREQGIRVLSVVPEPTTVALAALGCLAFCLRCMSNSNGDRQF